MREGGSVEGVSQLTGPISAHGEGACWSASWGGLRWVDMLRGDILTLPLDGSAPQRTHVGSVAAAIRPRCAGGAIVALEQQIVLLDSDYSIEYISPQLVSAGVRFNDGGCDPAGAFFCGTMRLDEQANGGTLYRFSERILSTAIAKVSISNGIDWAPDGSYALYVDTYTKRIDRLTFDKHGSLKSRALFAVVDHTDGWPDGLTVDSLGGAWLALWGGGEVRHYDAQGILDRRVFLPTTNITSCSLGGENLKTLFITSSQKGIDPSAEPLAGSLFSVESEIGGQPVREFAG
ncbi:SMP-30/gluconolactonase/LRE family protein [soil metagenome]